MKNPSRLLPTLTLLLGLMAAPLFAQLPTAPFDALMARRAVPPDLVLPHQSGSEFNLSFAGGKLLLNTEADFTWAGGANPAVALRSDSALAFITPDAAFTILLGGSVQVGLPNGYGAGSLTVVDDITEGGSQLSRWRGTGTADPASPQAGDLFYRTDTSKVRIHAGGSWINLN